MDIHRKAENSPLRHWRCLAAGLAFAWPLFWLARSLVQALPGFLAAWLSPYSLAMWGARPDGIFARVFPPGAVTEEYRPGMGAALQDPFGLAIVVALVAVPVLLWAGRRFASCGLIASLGGGYVALALLEAPLRTLWFRYGEVEWPTHATAAAGLALAIPALRAIAADVHSKTWLGRAGAGMLLLILPYAALASAFGRGSGWVQALLIAGLATPLALVAASIARQSARPLRLPGLRTVGAGVAASLAVFFLGSFRPLPPERSNAPTPAATAVSPDTPYPRLFFQRGVSFTSEWPDSYDSANAHAMLAKLRERGVDAIALVPYGVNRRGDGALRFGGWERDESIVALSNSAHALGMKVLLKPQVWVRGSYPGDLDFDSDEERLRWFAEYEALALHYAELAQRTHADLFCVGTEFAKLTRHEEYWRGLIAKVRKVYPGPLTYAANFGAEFENIAFWDALDYLGLNNYYPLPDNLDASAVVAKVEAVQARFGKPVIFTEAGYSSYAGGNRQPWAENQGPVDLEMQAAAYESVLAAFWEKPWFYGAYWWKVGSNSFGGPLDRTHTPWGKPAMEVLRRWYAKPAPGRQGEAHPALLSR